MLAMWSAFSIAQNPIRFQNITVNDGLSMGTITAFQKDDNGYMWIATAEGLHRYDGKRFKIFKHKEKVKNTLSDSYITALLSHSGKLYIGNHVGKMDIMDERTYEVSTIDFTLADQTFDNSIQQIIEYQGKIVIDTDGGGLWQYEPIHNKLRRIDILDIDKKEINQMIVHAGNLHLVTSREIVMTDFNNSKVVFESLNKPLSSLAPYNGGFYIGTNQGLFKVDNEFQDLQKVILPPKKRLINKINTIKTRGAITWVGTEGGLLKLENGNTYLFKTDNLRPFSLVNDQVSRLHIDDEGILWVGTIAGVSKYAPELNKFGLLQYFDFEDKTYNNNVYYTYEDRNKDIWLGTFTSGLVKLNSKHMISKLYPRLGKDPFESKSVRAIYEDSKGTFWIGTRSEGLFILDRQTGKSKMVASRENGLLKSNVIRNIFEDSEHRIWVATQQGLALKDSSTMSFTHYQADSLHRNNRIYQIEEDPKTGNLILASFRGGLQIFDPEKETFTVLKHDASDSTSISNNNLMSLTWINSDSLLIGTYGGGMNICDLRTQSFTSISESDGLVNNAVYGIIYGGKGSCWLSTNNGIVNYNIYTKEFTNFRPVHYLQSTEFNEGAFLKSSSGYYYFGGVSGLNYFKPEEILSDTTPSKVYYTDIRGAFTKKSQYTRELSFIDSRLEIDFTSLHYANPQGVFYSYRLSGYDNDWVPSGNLNTAVYPRLSPGSYTFQVKAEDEFGNWTSNSQDLKITIQPPFWQQWWFITLAILSIASFIYFIFRYRTREIERSYKLQLVDSELSALRSQMNPHFIFNSLNSIQYFILKKEPKEAYTYLSKFASLMRKILQNSRLKYISVSDEIEGLELYLEMEKMRMDNNLDFTIKTENISNPEDVNIPTMLIQPFVENSIVHGLLPKENDRRLDIIISKKSNHLQCTITDNGIGRDASRKMNEKRSSKHKSTGMDLTQKRLNILSEGKGNFDLKIHDLFNSEGQSCGTEVSLKMVTIN